MQGAAELRHAFAADLTAVAANDDGGADFTGGGVETTREVKLRAVSPRAAHGDEPREADVLEHEHDELTDGAVRELLQEAQDAATRRLAVALGHLLHVALETHELSVEGPIREADAPADESEAGPLSAAERSRVVGARRGDEHALAHRVLAEEAPATLGGVHQRLERDGTAVAIERPEQLGKTVGETTPGELVERRARAFVAVALVTALSRFGTATASGCVG